jgi:cobalt-zinc-cadmium efflux system protein
MRLSSVTVPAHDHHAGGQGHDHHAGGQGHDSHNGGPGHVQHVGGSHLHAGPDTSQTRLWVALALIAAFMALEVAAGILAHSLALISDAAHMLTDAAAVGLAIAALRMAARPARGALTYGLRRVDTLAAQINGATLLAFAGVIAYAAIVRLLAPPHVSPWPLVGVGLAGVAVNAAATVAVAGAGRHHLSVEGSYQHMLMDLLAFIGTVVAGIVILLTGFARADAIASLVVAALMARSGVGLLVAAARVLLEAAPAGVDPPEIGHAMAGMPGVVEVHDLHIWQVASGFPALSAHVLVGPDVDCHATRRTLEGLLRERFALEHSTLQVDHFGGDELIELQVSR